MIEKDIYYVEVVRISTGEVTASHGPMPEREAELLEAEIEADKEGFPQFEISVKDLRTKDTSTKQ